MDCYLSNGTLRCVWNTILGIRVVWGVVRVHEIDLSLEAMCFIHIIVRLGGSESGKVDRFRIASVKQ